MGSITPLLWARRLAGRLAGRIRRLTLRHVTQFGVVDAGLAPLTTAGRWARGLAPRTAVREGAGGLPAAANGVWRCVGSCTAAGSITTLTYWLPNPHALPLPSNSCKLLQARTFTAVYLPPHPRGIHPPRLQGACTRVCLAS